MTSIANKYGSLVRDAQICKKMFMGTLWNVWKWNDCFKSIDEGQLDGSIRGRSLIEESLMSDFCAFHAVAAAMAAARRRRPPQRRAAIHAAAQCLGLFKTLLRR